MIEINCPDGNVRNMKVTCNGHEIEGMTEMNVSFRPNEEIMATIKIPVGAIHCEGVKSLLMVEEQEQEPSPPEGATHVIYENKALDLELCFYKLIGSVFYVYSSYGEWLNWGEIGTEPAEEHMVKLYYLKAPS